MFVQPTIYVADFETTVTGENEKQESTEVWASAMVQLDTEDVHIHNSIAKWFSYVCSLSSNTHIYFHNLKFDGSFIVDFLLRIGYKNAINSWDGKWRENKYMSKGTFKYVIADNGPWYTITIKTEDGKMVTIKDSLKLLPFSVDVIGKSFGTKHKKLSMEYVGEMHADGEITEEQKEYIRNDVLVVKEALEIMFRDGYDKLTIGSCCKAEYLKTIDKQDAAQWFPNLTQENLPNGMDADSYIRKSYRGGWCYVKRGCENIIYHNGWTADVNSLYPSVMLDGKYPVGKPVFFEGSIPKEATKGSRCYFVRIRTRFYLKKGFLPCIQIKGNPHYDGTEWLETSDIRGRDGKYHSSYKGLDGNIHPAIVELTLTDLDYALIKKHYILEDTEIIDGCWFWSLDGKILFGEYINKWAKVKMESKGAKRQQAKLFLNNLYGKFAAKPNNSTKIAHLDENGVVKFDTIEDYDADKVWYIPIGAYCTSLARNFTISAAQKNYDIFLYADTDSIHCKAKPQDIPVDAVKFSHWKLETSWDEGIFVRQKTYIEHVVQEMENDNTMVDVEPYYNIKCAGMGKRPKELLNANLSHKKIDLKNEIEEDFMKHQLSLTDYKPGLKVPSDLSTKRIKGGVLLVEAPYDMKPANY